METFKEQQKGKAVECLKKLKIHNNYIDQFIRNDEVCFFMGFAGNWAWQDEKLMQKIQEIEKEYNSKVYAVVVSYTSYGTLYNMLLISRYPEEWDNLFKDSKNLNEFYAHSYCWNRHKECYSKFGKIVVKSQWGGIKRVA